MILFDWDTLILKEDNHLKVVRKGIKKVRTTNLLVIVVENWVIQQMFAGAKLSIRTPSRNTKDTATNKDIKKMNAGPRP